MAYQKNDTLLAFKAIALHASLNGTDKQVGVFLADSHNIGTGRCDPSVETASVTHRAVSARAHRNTMPASNCLKNSI